MSWWPKDSRWEKYGNATAWWSQWSEGWYQKRVTDIATDSKQPEPSGRNGWRQSLRNLRKGVEETAELVHQRAEAWIRASAFVEHVNNL